MSKYFFLTGFLTKNFHAILFFLKFATCLAHLIARDLIQL